MATRTKKTNKKSTKLFVLDTNVLMHDPSSLWRFEEHDIYIPSTVLEELDNHKKGHTEVARNSRETSRSIEALMQNMLEKDCHWMINEGLPLEHAPGITRKMGRIFIQTASEEIEVGNLLSTRDKEKADNWIIGAARMLRDKYKNRYGEVVLVSKDFNVRIKARALGVMAQDYQNDKVIEDTDLLPIGKRLLPDDFWETHGKGLTVSPTPHHSASYRVKGPLCPGFFVNELVYLESEPPFYAIVREVAGDSALLETIKDYTNEKRNVWGIQARNLEQNFALNLLMDPEVDFVTLMGQAGTGKTLLTLASALHQVLEEKAYSEIIFTRVTIPVGEDIGFLPGNEEEKMAPWMGALEDNLEVLSKTSEDGGDWGRAATRDIIRSKIKIKSLNFMRGRTFLNKFLIIDEAQNLTSKQMKTLITRAGPGTKVVCLGNVAQIDTPYLTEGSSGLTYVVDRFKGWAHNGHITLQRGERSRLADYASEVL